MQQFDLSLWLQDKSRKVVTRDGKPVRIVCWDNTPTMPVIVAGSGGNPWTTDKDGYYKHNHEESVFDLFFADEEEELTKIEQKPVWSEEEKYIRDVLIEYYENNDGPYGEINAEDVVSWLKSLKPRWKPLDEQMCAFRAVLDSYKMRVNDAVTNCAESLYNDLKSL